MILSLELSRLTVTHHLLAAREAASDSGVVESWRAPDLAALLVGCEAVFLPADPPRMGMVAFWRVDTTPLPETAYEPQELSVVRPHRSTVRRRTVEAVFVPVHEALAVLTRHRAAAAMASGGDLRAAGVTGSAAFWGTAALLGLRLVARGRLLPGVSPGGFDAWRVGPFDGEEVERLRELAACMPPDARAVPLKAGSPVLLPQAEPLVRAFLDAVADVLPRTAAARHAAGGPAFAVAAPQAIPERRAWAADVATGRDAGLEVSLRIEMPHDADNWDNPQGADADAAATFRAVVQVRSLADPTLLADAAAVWATAPTSADSFGDRVRVDVLLGLRRAARLWPPAERLLAKAVPDTLELTDTEALDLLGDAAQQLAAAGVAVHWPKELVRELTASGVLESRRQSNTSSSRSFLSSDQLLDFRWQVTLGGQELSAQELERLVAAHRPVVRLRDQWVLVDPALVRRLQRPGPAGLNPVDALSAALTGTIEVAGEQVEVRSSGVLEKIRARITDPHTRVAQERTGQPEQLAATLRDYQLRGLDWLDRMTALGLGGCLADDMGLGKTITLIALHLRRQQDKETAGPTLVVCPTSLLGNWEREITRFAPGTPVRRFHGPGRNLDDLGAEGGFVLTTYGTLRRDAALLAEAGWGLLVVDEAQHVKNPYAATAQALRQVPCGARVALTGTPVENNLSELWALLDWTTPGLLGTLATFRERYAKAVEGERDEQAAAQLAALVRPFLLRRRKSDPGIAPELPPKTETDQPVALTREQVSLYETLVRELMAEIEGRQGMARRGLVMKLLTGLKQVCNHPAQYLKEKDPGRIAGRSGKLELLDELLDTIVAEDGSVLVFTQYVEMGRLIEAHLTGRGVGVQFLHGQTPVKRREEMVAAFQDGQVPVFLLSLKAAGTGLNLTRAGHVIHYDRWWNPAVEDQATDRAYRIGQTQPVQVHRLIAEGTVEDRIAEMLTQKKELADAVLHGGEAALTELSDAELADLVALRRTA